MLSECNQLIMNVKHIKLRRISSRILLLKKKIKLFKSFKQIFPHLYIPKIICLLTNKKNNVPNSVTGNSINIYSPAQYNSYI